MLNMQESRLEFQNSKEIMNWFSPKQSSNHNCMAESHVLSGIATLQS
jgi:hypothetical protein